MGVTAFAPSIDTNPSDVPKRPGFRRGLASRRAWCCPDCTRWRQAWCGTLVLNREAVTARNQCDAAATVVPRYDALVRVSEALRAYRDRDSLFSSLARELRPVLGFSFLSIGLYDARTHTVDRLGTRSDRRAARAARPTADESLTYFVVTQQKPLLIPDVELETRFSQAMGYMRQQHMRSTCSLPLTTRQRRIGMLLAASTEPDAYGSEDVAFLSLVANQVALAIDDAMNYGDLQDALALERERQRNLEASDELLRALSTVLDIRQVFPQVSSIAAAIVPHDLLTFTFHNRGGEVVLQAALADWEPLPTRLKLAPSSALDEGFAIVNDLCPKNARSSSRRGSGSACTRPSYESCLDVRLRRAISCSACSSGRSGPERSRRTMSWSPGASPTTSRSRSRTSSWSRWRGRRPKPRCGRSSSRRGSGRSPTSSR